MFQYLKNKDGIGILPGYSTEILVAKKWLSGELPKQSFAQNVFTVLMQHHVCKPLNPFMTETIII